MANVACFGTATYNLRCMLSAVWLNLITMYTIVFVVPYYVEIIESNRI